VNAKALEPRCRALQLSPGARPRLLPVQARCRLLAEQPITLRRWAQGGDACRFGSGPRQAWGMWIHGPDSDRAGGGLHETALGYGFETKEPEGTAWLPCCCPCRLGTAGGRPSDIQALDPLTGSVNRDGRESQRETTPGLELRRSQGPESPQPSLPPGGAAMPCTPRTQAAIARPAGDWLG